MIAALAMLPAPAVAGATEDQAPIIRCLVATGMLSRSTDKTFATAGMMGSLYWLGRLDQSLSEEEIERKMVALSTTLTQADINLDLQRCGAEMQARGAMMTRIGEKLMARAGKSETR